MTFSCIGTVLFILVTTEQPETSTRQTLQGQSDHQCSLWYGQRSTGCTNDRVNAVDPIVVFKSTVRMVFTLGTAMQMRCWENGSWISYEQGEYCVPVWWDWEIIGRCSPHILGGHETKWMATCFEWSKLLQIFVCSSGTASTERQRNLKIWHKEIRDECLD